MGFIHRITNCRRAGIGTGTQFLDLRLSRVAESVVYLRKQSVKLTVSRCDFRGEREMFDRRREVALGHGRLPEPVKGVGTAIIPFESPTELLARAIELTDLQKRVAEVDIQGRIVNAQGGRPLVIGDRIRRTVPGDDECDPVRPSIFGRVKLGRTAVGMNGLAVKVVRMINHAQPTPRRRGLGVATHGLAFGLDLGENLRLDLGGDQGRQLRTPAIDRGGRRSPQHPRADGDQRQDRPGPEENVNSTARQSDDLPSSLRSVISRFAGPAPNASSDPSGHCTWIRSTWSAVPRPK